MIRLTPSWIVVATAAICGSARADVPEPTGTQPTAPQTQVEADEELRQMAAAAEAEAEAGAETIEIIGERPAKIFDRDTDVRLTGAQLAARGATDLASALALLPDVSVREAGRGGQIIDIRGARKGSVSIFIDGVKVSDPFYGTFDVSTIPITDIVQIRVSTNPQSPIDGAGGPGGVVEVHTRDALGPQVVIARVIGDSFPSLGMTGTARVALTKHLALRVSASGLASNRELKIDGRSSLGEARHVSTGAARLEARHGDRRILVDAFVDSRHYFTHPGEANGSVLLVDRETSGRGSAQLEDKVGTLSLQTQLWTHHLRRTSRKFGDVSLDFPSGVEQLASSRTGGRALVTRPFVTRARWAVSAGVDREDAEVRDQVGAATGTTTVINLAGDLQYESKRFRIDGAVGVVAPFGIDTDPWPELKIAAKYRPVQHLELTATGGHKGRIPTLRERYDRVDGNPELRPERVWHAEIRAVEQVDDRLRVEVAPYLRRITDLIDRGVDPATGDSEQQNFAAIQILGVDSSARVRVHHAIELGGSFNYISPSIKVSQLPTYRVDGWVQLTPAKQISLLARVRTVAESSDGRGSLPAYTLFETTLTAPVTSEYLGVLRIEDLLDRAPQTRFGVPGAGRLVTLVVQGTWE